eukprot:TRINITY_DN2539_c0_g1_i3.p1 TRINITY_DN2539_c0_g1~~TRINITY_DN2539_c0_g1_i3.p1  ORF type:complete len:195 (+),score=44.14 TRINITY_DN2539_c0_g1_i3:62-646(+)
MKPTLFNVTLEEIVCRPADTDASAGVPKILTTLTTAILERGQQTEGIFRVPGDADEVSALRLQLDGSNYNVSKYDPHVLSGLLKLWLRELGDPLIPTEVYPKCISAANDVEASVKAAMELPPLNLRVLKYLVAFLRQMGSAANQQITKMSVDNIAMVFCPNVLRCPSTDVTVVMYNSQYERMFVRNLILHLPIE